MLDILKSSYCRLCYSILSLLALSNLPLSAYVNVPRSEADTTSRMNMGGDPPTRPGLLDTQRSPEYLDDWWGINDYYYSQHGIVENHGNPYDTAYDSLSPPTYPLPNVRYQNPGYNNDDNRNYRSDMPR